MPLDKAPMREYQRKRRAKTGQTHVSSQGYPRRVNGNLVLKPGLYQEGHVHNYVRKLGENTAKCNECLEVVEYEGKSLNIYTDGRADWPELIRDSKTADAIQKKMPVTPKRDQR